MPWKECHVMDERLRFCGPPARGRKDGAAVRRVRHLPQDRLQNLRPLQRLRTHRIHGSQPPALSPGESAAGADRGDDRPAEARVPRMGRAEDPRKIAAAGHAVAPASH